MILIYGITHSVFLPLISFRKLAEMGYIEVAFLQYFIPLFQFTLLQSPKITLEPKYSL